MNAPQSTAVLEKPSLQSLPVTALAPSKTHVQEVRRGRFSEAELKELAEDIKLNGIMHQPIVRLVGAKGYEIVIGERRWLAAKRLGMKEIFVNVRELSDEKALQMQISENMRRKNLHELEEAEGYEELMEMSKISPEMLADIVGRSTSYISKRTKLLNLCPEARKAFYAGELDASTALLIARIQGAEFQKRAIEDLKHERECGECLTVKEASDFIRDRFMLRLKSAPFDPKDEKLLPAAGSCDKCPKRSGNQVDLFEVKETDICTDLKCFDQKRQAHFAVARMKLEAQGKKVIYGDAAKKAVPNWETGGEYVEGGYARINDFNHDLGSTVAAALPKDYQPVLIQHPASGKIIEAATMQAVTKARLQAKGKRSAPAGSMRSSAPKPKKAKGPDVDQQLTERLVKLIREKAPPKEFSKFFLSGLAIRVLRMSNANSEDLAYSCKARGWPASALSGNRYGDEKKLPAQAAKYDIRELTLLMLEIAFHSDRYHRKPILELFGINEEKTREIVIEERKAARSKKKG